MNLFLMKYFKQELHSVQTIRPTWLLAFCLLVLAQLLQMIVWFSCKNERAGVLSFLLGSLYSLMSCKAASLSLTQYRTDVGCHMILPSWTWCKYIQDKVLSKLRVDQNWTLDMTPVLRLTETKWYFLFCEMFLYLLQVNTV